MHLPFTILTFMLFTYSSYAQTIIKDSSDTPATNTYSSDSIYNYVKNKTKNKFWGNSTYIASHLLLARNAELGVSLGRTNGLASIHDRGMGSYDMTSWGVSYNISKLKHKPHHLAGIFYEYNFLPFLLIGNYTLRGEYLHDFSAKQHYLRPSIGFNLLFCDITYNYSFKIGSNHESNIYKHGVAFRVKYFIGRKNWERRIRTRYPEISQGK